MTVILSAMRGSISSALARSVEVPSRATNSGRSSSRMASSTISRAPGEGTGVCSSGMGLSAPSTTGYFPVMSISAMTLRISS